MKSENVCLRTRVVEKTQDRQNGPVSPRNVTHSVKKARNPAENVRSAKGKSTEKAHREKPVGAILLQKLMPPLEQSSVVFTAAH